VTKKHIKVTGHDELYAIHLVMNRWRKEGRLEILGKGRDDKWKRKK